MEHQLDRALQDTLTSLTKVRPKAAGLLSRARLAVVDAYRGPDGHAV